MFRKKVKILFLLLIFVLLAGCSNSNNIVGKWNYIQNDISNENIYYIFNKNKTGEYNYYGEISKFKYEDRGTKIVIDYENSSVSNELDYVIDENVLKIKDSHGEYVTYMRK